MNFLLVGLPLGGVHRIAEVARWRVSRSPRIPCHLDGVADGALHPAGAGAEALGHLGIEHLCDGIDDVHILHCDENGLLQILVAPDVGGYADP